MAKSKLKGRARSVIARKDAEGKLKVLTFHQSASIDHDLAQELKKVKTEFESKEKNSRAYVAKVELASYAR